jgi:tripeptide aminopeptidase
MAFNVDGRSASEITVGAVGADRWEVEVRGKAAHAGVHPERGISASVVVALAMTEVFEGGWFGKRSHDANFVKDITAAFKSAFETAGKRVKDHEGHTAKVKFTSRRDYHPFRLKEDGPVVKHAAAAVRAIGREPVLRVTNGGLDANWMVRHGIPTITFGAGQNDIHTVKEWVDIPEFEAGCRLALALATL